MAADEEGTLATPEGVAPRVHRSPDQRASRPHRQAHGRRRARSSSPAWSMRVRMRGGAAAAAWPSATRTSPTERQIEFRIGINLGDVIVDGDDIYGDGVNVAATARGPGRSRRRRRFRHRLWIQAKNNIDAGFEYLGEQQVKNLPEPVRTYRVLLDPEAAGTIKGESAQEIALGLGGRGKRRAGHRGYGPRHGPDPVVGATLGTG